MFGAATSVSVFFGEPPFKSAEFVRAIVESGVSGDPASGPGVSGIATGPAAGIGFRDFGLKSNATGAPTAFDSNRLSAEWTLLMAA